MAYDNTNNGALFRNQRKEKPNHPDYRGKINVEGKDFELSAWLKKSKEGTPYMSLAVSEPYDKGGQSNSAPEEPDTTVQEDDDVPF